MTLSEWIYERRVSGCLIRKMGGSGRRRERKQKVFRFEHLCRVYSQPLEVYA
jgi:hypothetical protein